MAIRRVAAAGLALLLAPQVAGLRSRQGPVPDNDIATSRETTGRSSSRHTLKSYKQRLAQKLQTLIPETMYKRSTSSVSSRVKGKQPIGTPGELENRPGHFTRMTDCQMNGESSCALSSLPSGGITGIAPGGRTRCIRGADFQFQVVPGATDKLYLHLGGGGACWDEITTTTMRVCQTQADIIDFTGYANLCPGDNPFKGYTSIYVPHCSGDLHGGNISRPWENPDDDTVPIEQRGYYNVRSVIDWIKTNMAPKLSHFAFAGESAGSIGVQVWSSKLLKEFKYDKAHVLGDSFVGVFPENFQGKIFKELGACELVLEGESQEKCRSGKVSISEVFEKTIKEFPDVVFGHLTSKHDTIQTSFYTIAATTMRIAEVKEWCGDVDPDDCDLDDAPDKFNELPERLTSEGYHAKMEAIVEQFSQQPNYISYLMSSNCHVCGMTVFGSCPFVDYYQSVGGPGGWMNGENGAQRLDVQKWATNFFDDSRSKSSQCELFLLYDLESRDEDDWCSAKQQKKRLS